jgi:predicted aspartyl protease
MFKHVFFLVLITSLGILFTGNLSYARKKTETPDFGFHINKYRRSSTIPFRYLSNLILVKVKVNKSDSLNFIVDTGVSNIILTDPTLAETLGMKKSRNITISGSGSGKAPKAYVSFGNHISIGNITGKNQNIIVLEADFMQLSELVGEKIHGIVGYDLFNYFVVNINFQTRRLHFKRPENFRYKPRMGKALPIEIVNSKPYLNEVIIKNNNFVSSQRLMIDTGAGHATSLENIYDQEILPKTTLSASLGFGMNGEIFGDLGRIESVRLGNFELKNIIGTFPNKNSIPTQQARNGTIGCELLHLFELTFNYREKYLILKPNFTKLKEPFEYNMAGFDVVAKGELFKELYVQKVIPNGPADQAGIREGDQLMRIDNISAMDLNLSNLYKMLQKGHGKSLQLLLQRNKKMIFAECILQRQI